MQVIERETHYGNTLVLLPALHPHCHCLKCTRSPHSGSGWLQLGGESEGCMLLFCPLTSSKLLSFVAVPYINSDPFLVETYSAVSPND